MGHGYVERMFGDNCHFTDSSQKRFWRQHYERPVNIFNFGCGSGYTSDFCGGFGWGNFPGGCYCGDNNFSWGWFAAGAVTSILGWIGMFAFGNNNNNGAFSVSGSHLGTSASDGSHRPYRGRSLSGGAGSAGGAGGAGGAGDAGGAGNADTPHLNNLEKRLENTINGNGGNDNLDNLLIEVEERILSPLDEANKDDDIELYQRLKNRIIAAMGDNGEDVSSLANGITIKIGDKIINTEADLNGLDLSNVDKNTAICTLLKLGYYGPDHFSTKAGQNVTVTEAGSTHYNCGYLSTNPQIIKLLIKAGVTVEIFGDETRENRDNWLAGPITAYEIDSNGNLTSFTFSCVDTGENPFRGTYKVSVDENNNFDIAPTPDSATQTISGGQDMTYNANTKRLEGSILINRAR